MLAGEKKNYDIFGFENSSSSWCLIATHFWRSLSWTPLYGEFMNIFWLEQEKKMNFKWTVPWETEIAWF